MGIFIRSLIICTVLLCACHNEHHPTHKKIRHINIKKTTRLDSCQSSPLCSIMIEVDDMTDTTVSTQNINQTIALEAFGHASYSLAQAADSFCTEYILRYKKELAHLYAADQKRGIHSSWYDFKYRIAVKHQGGINGYHCYRIDKTKYEGGAFEHRQLSCLNFNGLTGKLVKLDDVLRPACHTLLHPLLINELLRQFECNNREELQEKGLLRLTDIYIPANYELGKDYISFIYNAGEIGPHKTGTIILPIPYTRIRTIMKPQK